MAYITLNTKKLKDNFRYLNKLFKHNGIRWAVVSKMLSGNTLYLSELLKLDIKQICDSRVANLKSIKKINPDITTIYIKPPAKDTVPDIIKYADISVNTQRATIRLLSKEAVLQNKNHKIIIMIELGELREGIMRDDFIDFYEEVFRMKNIEVVGIGANLSCLYGVLPSPDKLIQLCLYEQLIEAKFNKQIMYVSGGSSVTIPLISQNILPKGINHFRVGETLFLGTNVYSNDTFEFMHSDVFKLYSTIIELIEKPQVPTGEFGTNVEGNEFEFDEELIGQKTYRAIIDLGLLDVDESHIEPIDEDIKFVGASSDMLVIDLGKNLNKYKVGDVLEFKMDYMGTLRAINSKYINKILEE